MTELITAIRELSAALRQTKKEDLTEYDIGLLKDLMRQLHDFIQEHSTDTS